ncbi:MAG: CBS domain-containing protein [Desulfovibrio sp.]|nr:CBS domain-containing protein [Desulfovibrio sp.]
MLILDWMKTKVISVTPDMTLRQARRLFREHNINRLPVVDDKFMVIGLLSTADLKRYAPTNATGVEILEALELLDTTKVREAMVPNPVTIGPHNTIEQAAQKMIDRHVACLPVTDSAGKLLGIMTGMDVFKALLDLSGSDQPGVEAGFLLPYKPGTLREVLDKLRSQGMRIISVLSSVRGTDMRKVKIRFRGDDEASQNKALEMFREHPGLRYWARGDEFFLKEEHLDDVHKSVQDAAQN